MSGRVSDKSGLRDALIDAAARLIATEGIAALTLRRVAEEVGTSTMAIYTHFGGMDELRRAVRHEGYARLAADLARVETSADPVGDLSLLGRAYYDHAISNPHLYRVMFMEHPLADDDATLGAQNYEVLVRAVERCIDAGRFGRDDPRELGREFWAIGHGVIGLQLADLLTPAEALRCLGSLVFRLYTASGDSPEAAGRSLARAIRTAEVTA